MMPKGVEHRRVRRAFSCSRGVKIPMMPKGVEHKTYADLAKSNALSEDSNDAERR
jgi:hypothetical protein